MEIAYEVDPPAPPAAIAANVPATAGTQDSDVPRPFDSVARMPAPSDNCAIVTCTLDEGTQIALPASLGGGIVALSSTCLEGHRFCVRAIAEGGFLLSWGLPFGIALADIAPGTYVCNQRVLSSLAKKRLPFAMPRAPNFVFEWRKFALPEGMPPPNVRQVPLYPPGERATFAGFARGGGRGVGTHNFVVVIGTTARTAALARRVAAVAGGAWGGHGPGGGEGDSCDSCDGVARQDSAEHFFFRSERAAHWHKLRPGPSSPLSVLRGSF